MVYVCVLWVQSCSCMVYVCVLWVKSCSCMVYVCVLWVQSCSCMVCVWGGGGYGLLLHVAVAVCKVPPLHVRVVRYEAHLCLNGRG